MALTFKSPTNSTRSPTRSRNNKQKARRAAQRANLPSEVAKRANQNNNQRANLPSEVAKQYAQPAITQPKQSRPATPIVSAAKSYSGPAKATIVSSPMPSISAAENTQIDTAFAAKRTPKVKTTMGTETTGYGVNNSILGATGTSMMASLNSTNPLKVSPTGTQAKAVTNGSVPSYSQGNGAMSAASSPLKQAKPLLSVAPTNLPARNYGAFDMDTYQSVAKTNEDSIIPSVLLSAIKNDKYRNDEVSYNQAYWAGLRSGNTSQADMKAKQDAIGMKKSYSGDRVITPDMQRQASDDLSRLTGSMATLGDGVTKTVGDTYGLLGERQDTTFKYEDGTSIVQKGYDPSLFGVNFGAKTSTTYVDGVEVQTKSGRDPLGRDAKITKPDGLARGINDRVEAGPDAAKELSNIDNQIKTETDPAKLRALHKRRLMLMRMNRTNTKFAGLLGEADTKRTNLMSIS